jgi:hypothetical protein
LLSPNVNQVRGAFFFEATRNKPQQIQSVIWGLTSLYAAFGFDVSGVNVCDAAELEGELPVPATGCGLR